MRLFACNMGSMDSNLSTKPLDRFGLERLAFETYVDCGLSATAAAHQLGIPVNTLRGRVRRFSLRIARHP